VQLVALLILIAALWGVVLLPTLLKRRTEKRQVGSIDHFHHQLHLLERASPKIVSPAYRLETVEAQGAVGVGASGYPAISSMPERPNLVLLRPVAPGEAADDEVVDDATGDHYQRVGPPALGELPRRESEAVAEVERRQPHVADAEHARLRETRRRRRDFVALLLGTMVFTALLGLVPSLHLLWAVTVMSALGLAAYVTVAAMAMRNDVDVAAVRRTGVRPPRRAPLPETATAVVEADGGRRSLAAAGYPGAWDELDESSAEQPRRAAAR
jgi:hypothetical protein